MSVLHSGPAPPASRPAWLRKLRRPLRQVQVFSWLPSCCGRVPFSVLLQCLSSDHPGNLRAETLAKALVLLCNSVSYCSFEVLPLFQFLWKSWSVMSRLPLVHPKAQSLLCLPLGHYCPGGVCFDFVCLFLRRPASVPGGKETTTPQRKALAGALYSLPNPESPFILPFHTSRKNLPVFFSPYCFRPVYFCALSSPFADPHSCPQALNSDLQLSLWLLATPGSHSTHT